MIIVALMQTEEMLLLTLLKLVVKAPHTFGL